MKIILAGTPEFAANAFKNLIGEFEIVAFITQPDRQNNRNHKILFSPVKNLALKTKIKLFQPENIATIYPELKQLKFDIFLTCAFGQFIPQKILDLASIASLNIHASLLPRYRGAAPIHHAILNGDKKTGISLMYMIKKMDAGDVLFTKEIEITKTDNSGQMFQKLSNLAKINIVSWLKQLESKNFQVVKQDLQNVSIARKIEKHEGEIKAGDTVLRAQRKILAFTPNPGAFIIFKNIKYKLLSFNQNAGLKIKLLDGILYVNEIQKPGKRVLGYKDFFNGTKIDYINFG